MLQMGGMECVITGLMDEFHGFFKSKKHSREIFTFCAVAVSFSIALVNVTPVSFWLRIYAGGATVLRLLIMAYRGGCLEIKTLLL